MRTPSINNSLEASITRKRLAKYLAATGDDLDKALQLYEENTRLSEAFYSPLQAVEVCLRNKLNVQLSGRFGSDWFQNGQPGFHPDSEQMIVDALRDLQHKPLPTDPDDVVAELKFAFWVGLIGPKYDSTLWRQCLHRAFLVRKPRSVIHGRFNALRRFRNRIMHHEPIFHRPLLQLHNELIDSIRWMCSDTSSWAAFHSRFDEVSTTRPKL